MVQKLSNIQQQRYNNAFDIVSSLYWAVAVIATNSHGQRSYFISQIDDPCKGDKNGEWDLRHSFSPTQIIKLSENGQLVLGQHKSITRIFTLVNPESELGQLISAANDHTDLTELARKKGLIPTPGQLVG